jgi:hypothetical protein
MDMGQTGISGAMSVGGVPLQFLPHGRITVQNDWKLLVEHCFRSGSSAFAPECFEYQTAVRMFEEAKRVGASDKEILSTIRAFMKIKGANEMQISDEAHYAQILLRYSNRTAERVALRGNRSSRFSAL